MTKMLRTGLESNYFQRYNITRQEVPLYFQTIYCMHFMIIDFDEQMLWHINKNTHIQI